MNYFMNNKPGEMFEFNVVTQYKLMHCRDAITNAMELINFVREFGILLITTACVTYFVFRLLLRIFEISDIMLELADRVLIKLG